MHPASDQYGLFDLSCVVDDTSDTFRLRHHAGSQSELSEYLLTQKKKQKKNTQNYQVKNKRTPVPHLVSLQVDRSEKLEKVTVFKKPQRLTELEMQSNIDQLYSR